VSSLCNTIPERAFELRNALDGDILEVDHHIPRYLGGKDTLDNKNILHRHCHDQRYTAFEESRRKAKQLEEACRKSEHAPQLEWYS